MTTRSPWILVLAFVLATDPSATRAAQKQSVKAPKPETHAAPAKASQAHPADHGKHPEKKAPAADSHAKSGVKPAGKHAESHAAPVGHGTAKHGEHGAGKDHSEPPAKEPDIDATLDQFVREGMGKSFRPAQPKPKTVDELKLESTEEFIDNTNLVKHVDKPSKTNEVWEIRRHWFALRSARELRQGADPQQAILILVRLLEALDTPKEVKGQALYELGLAAQQAGKTPRAFQIFSQFVHRFSEDPRVPEALYRQGVLQREMGAKQLALSKFYSVLSTSLKLKDGQFGDYEELVLKAQTEIADTHFAFGDYELAGDFYQRQQWPFGLPLRFTSARRRRRTRGRRQTQCHPPPGRRHHRLHRDRMPLRSARRPQLRLRRRQRELIDCHRVGATTDDGVLMGARLRLQKGSFGSV